MNNIKGIFGIILMCTCSHLLSNTADTSKLNMNKKAFVLSTNIIYNYYSNKTLVTFDNPRGFIPNSTEIIYYQQYKYLDTYTYDFSATYNKPLTKKFSFSTGLRLDLLKEDKKTLVYIDSNANKPDLKRTVYKTYSVSVPLICNYYVNRFKFSTGINIYILNFRKSIYTYENNNKTYLNNKFIDLPYFLIQETIAYKIFKKHNLYTQLSVMQTTDLYRRYGYYNYFCIGLNYQL